MASIEVTPASLSLLPGESVTLSATLRDSLGNVLPGLKVAWAATGPYLTVDANGRVEAVEPTGLGAEVRATHGSVTGKAAVWVARRAHSMRILGTGVIRREREARLVVEFVDVAGRTILIRPEARWSSSDSTVLSVGPTGVIAAKREGTVTVSAEAAGVSASARMRVVSRGYRLTFLGESRTAASLNDRGQVVGTLELPREVTHAFFWQDGVTTDLGAGEVRSSARAINNRGQIAGTAGGAGGAAWPALWQDGRLTHHLPRDGEAVDLTEDGTALIFCGYDCVYLWRDRDTTRVRADRTIHAATALRRDGSVGGSAWDSPHQAALIRDGKATILAYAGSSSVVTGLNEAGQATVAFHAHSKDGGFCEGACGFLWSEGKLTKLGTLGEWSVLPRALNEQGQVVGTVGGRNERERGFLWQDGAMMELSALLAEPDWVVLSAADINESGQIVGQARNVRTGQTGAVLLSPEP